MYNFYKIFKFSAIRTASSPYHGYQPCFLQDLLFQTIAAVIIHNTHASEKLCAHSILPCPRSRLRKERLLYCPFLYGSFLSCTNRYTTPLGGVASLVQLCSPFA